MTELLAPAGNSEALDAAISEGADAVYMGLKSFNARLRSSNFAWNQFEAAVQSVHRLGKKIYVTVNTVCEERETERLYRFLSYLNKIGPDGIIVQDFGVIRMCQEFFPDMEIHASTQMNVASAAAANLLCKQGVKRIVAARELGLEEIRSLKAHTTAEIELFVHGALCVSESGLCLFSSYLGGKSANRGMCTQACRRLYSAEIPGTISSGYYFSPCDLELIAHVPELMEAGIDSFKIEGRMKSAEYVGAVTAAYRYVMDNWQSDRKGSIAEGRRILSTDFARAKTDYWYGFKTAAEGVDCAGAKILNPAQAGGTGIFLGKISAVRPASAEEKKQRAASMEKADDISIQMAVISGGDYEPDPGDSIRIHKKDDSGRKSHKVRVLSRDEKERRWIDIPGEFKTGDSVYLLQTKSMSKRYKKILPQDLSRFRRQPGAELLPVLDLTPLEKNELSWFPEGLYIQVSTVADAHIVSALHPVRLILELNSETLHDLLAKDTPGNPVLPYSRKMVVLSLDPFAAEGAMPELEKNLGALIESGYQAFAVNNLAHITVLKRYKNVKMMAGPYLYTFNRWAVSFLENHGIMALQSPAEISEKTLDGIFETAQQRSRVLLSVFSYPVLFRMRFKLPEEYDFTYFSDKEETGFKVNSTPDGSFVMPELPFSLLDKMDTLKTKGWTHQLIDFSKTRILKSDIRNVLSIIRNRQFVDGASRFNWKDGFYSPEKIEAYKAAAERNAEQRLAARKGRLKKNGGKNR